MSFKQSWTKQLRCTLTQEKNNLHCSTSSSKFKFLWAYNWWTHDLFSQSRLSQYWFTSLRVIHRNSEPFLADISKIMTDFLNCWKMARAWFLIWHMRASRALLVQSVFPSKYIKASSSILVGSSNLLRQHLSLTKIVLSDWGQHSISKSSSTITT